MKFLKVVLCFLVVVVFHACGGGSATKVTQTQAPVSSATIVQVSTPVSVTPSAVVTQTGMETVSWSQIVGLIKGCEAKSVFSTHNQMVIVQVKNDQLYRTTEPQGESVIEIARNVPCDPPPILAME